MKIVVIDHFGRESRSNRLAAENVPEHYAKAIVDFLNNKFSGNMAPDFFVVRPDDYELYKFKP